MKKIIGTRGIGKTKQLLYYAKDNDATVICANPSYMQEKAIAYGITGLNFLSYDDFWLQVKSNYYDHDIKYVIDEIDGYIKALRKKIIAYNFSIDD